MSSAQKILILESQEPISEIVEPDYPISNKTPLLFSRNMNQSAPVGAVKNKITQLLPEVAKMYKIAKKENILYAA
jgi:hypothetical protein